jgi:hypothetical protein
MAGSHENFVKIKRYSKVTGILTSRRSTEFPEGFCSAASVRKMISSFKEQTY